MENLVIDLCIILSGIVLYGVEFLLAHQPTVIGVAIDICMLGVFFYRLFENKYTKAVFLIMFLPLFNALDFVNITWFNGIFSSQILLLITAVAFAFIYLEVYTKPGTRRVILERVPQKQKTTNAGDFPVKLNNSNIMISEQSRYTHLQVIGATGSGKTRFIFYPHIMQDISSGAGVLIFDIKSNMNDKIESFVAKANRENDYYCFNLGDLNSDSYNPLAGDQPGEIFNRIFDALYTDRGNSEQFYIDIAERFLKAAIGVLKKKYETITFEDLYWATVSPKTYLQPICNEFPDVIYAKDILDLLKKPDLEKNLMGLVNKLAQFVTPDWAVQINTTKPKIDIGKIVSEGKILLFQVNSGKFQQEYKTISVLLMMHMQAEIARRYSTRRDLLKPFYMYLDEFDKIIYPKFPELINKAREAKVGLIFGHQSLGDLKKHGAEFQDQILTNARNKVIFKSDEPATAEYFSNSFGTKTIERKVKSYAHDGSVSGLTDRLEEQFNIHPNDIKFLRLGEGIVKIEDGYSGPTFIQKIGFGDIKAEYMDGQFHRMPKTVIDDEKTTNLDLSTTIIDDKKGKSGGLKWKHIKADSEDIKDKDKDNKNEEDDNEDFGEGMVKKKK
jgi:hypothetical protein